MARPVAPRGLARTRVLDAALALFAEHGVHGTSLQMIADRVGVTKAAVYYQFRSKEDIALEVLRPSIDDMARVIRIAEALPDAIHTAAQMITIDEHRVCYDGNIEPHVHFYCKECGKIIDLFDEPAPRVTETKVIDGNIVQEEQLYYKGICSACAKKMEKKTN